jgi:hypothetical protein
MMLERGQGKGGKKDTTTRRRRTPSLKGQSFDLVSSHESIYY